MELEIFLKFIKAEVSVVQAGEGRGQSRLFCVACLGNGFRQTNVLLGRALQVIACFEIRADECFEIDNPQIVGKLGDDLLLRCLWSLVFHRQPHRDHTQFGRQRLRF